MHTVKSTAWIRRQPRRFTCRGVVFSASALGTMELLFHLREKGSLPAISDGWESMCAPIPSRSSECGLPGCGDDLSKGIAIGSGVYIDEHTHIEAVRYPNGSDAMSLLTTLLTGWPSWLAAHRALAQKRRRSLLRHPVKTMRCFGRGDGRAKA